MLNYKDVQDKQTKSGLSLGNQTFGKCHLLSKCQHNLWALPWATRGMEHASLPMVDNTFFARDLVSDYIST